MFHPSWLLLLLFCQIIHIRLLETCERTVQLKTNTIILPKQDSDTGVEFLKKLPVRSLKECYTACCNLSACTRAVYKSKVSKECFLFNCTRPESCVYKAQANYDVVILTSKAQESYHQIELGGSCDPTHTCATNHSECSNGQCVCQSGWITKDSICVRSVCKTPDLQFQCSDASMCVAVYDRCNGVIECPDGSDETGCSAGLLSTSASTDFRSQSSSPSFYRKTSNNLTDNFEKTKSLDYMLRTPSPNLNAAKDDEIWERNEFSTDRQAQNYISQKLSDVERVPSNRISPEAFHVEQSRPRMSSGSRFSGSQPYHLSPRLNSARTRLLSDPPMHPTHWYTEDGIWDSPDRPSSTNDIIVRPVPHRLRYPPYLLEDVVDQNNLYSLPPRGYARNADGFSLDGFQSPRSYLERHKIYTDPSSSEPRPDSYVNHGPSVTDYARAHHHDRDRVQDTEELIDPSILSGLHAQDWNDRPPKYRSRAWPAHFRQHVHEEHPVAHIMSHKNEHSAVQKKQERALPTPPSVDSEHPANDAVLTAFRRSQSEGHTAALILAFSLGLVCCFVCLLIVEWKRRHRLQPFRRRPTMPVSFGDRGKLTVIRSRSGRRGKQVIRDMNNPVGTEDENKALCDELVL